MKLTVATVATVLLWVSTAAAQLAITPKIGTLGYGADITIGLSNKVNLRAGYAVGEYEPKIETDIEYDGQLDLANGSLLLDIHPGENPFRFSVGTVINNSDATARSTEQTTIIVNGVPYRVADVGTLVGTMTFDDYAPYLGIGYGNAVRGGRVSFAFDLGAAYFGEAEVDLQAFPNDPDQPLPPGFEADLQAEEADLQQEVSDYKIYPVIQIGIAIRF